MSHIPKRYVIGTPDEPPICPYCEVPSKYLSSSESVYNGHDFGPLYQCEQCGARAGVHKRTTIPLGRLANSDLRRLRQQAHEAFDPIWRERFSKERRHDRLITPVRVRNDRYAALAMLLNIPKEDCHIGYFDDELCRQTIDICRRGLLG